MQLSDFSGAPDKLGAPKLHRGGDRVRPLSAGDTVGIYAAYSEDSGLKVRLLKRGTQELQVRPGRRKGEHDNSRRCAGR